MANDFSSKQIRASQLIASGGIGSTTIGLMIYSASDATDLSGGTNNSLTAGIGPDVFLFVSGTEDGKNRGTGVSLFGGDVVVSGTLYAEKQVIEVDENVTGSMTVQGTLFVSSSADIAGGLTVNKDLGGTIGDGFIAKSSAIGKELIRTLPNLDQVLILSGGSDKSYDESTSLDVSFYVSGSTGFIGGGRKGIAVFGGDTVVSGNLRVEGSSVTISETIDHVGDSDTFLKFDTDKITLEAGGKNMAQLIEDGENNRVLILSGGSDKAYDESGGSDVSFYVSGSVSKRGTGERGTSVFGGDLHVSGAVTSDVTQFGQWTLALSPTRIYPNSAAGTHVLVGGTTLSAADTILASDGGATFNDNGASVDFRVESNTKENAILVDGSSDQVLILSGGSKSSNDEALGSDINFYVSGSVGSRGTSARGTSLFGGDVAISGSLRSDSDIDVGGSILVDRFIMHKGDTNTAIDFTDDKITIDVGGREFITMTEAVQDTIEFNVLESANFNFIVNASSNESFSVSDSGVVVNEGGAPACDFRVQSNNYEKAIYLDSDNQFIQFLEAASETPGNDVNFHVSGTVGSKGSATRGTAVFGGDVFVSGSLGVNTVNVTSDGKLGLGVTSPAYKLSVGGNAEFGEYLFHRGDADTSIRFQDDRVTIRAGSRDMLDIVEASGDQFLILSGGSDKSNDEAQKPDVGFYVSGSKGIRGNNDRGVAVFGGDLVASGTMSISGSLSDAFNSNAKLEFANGHPNNFRIMSGDGNQVIARDAGGTPDAIVLNSDGAAISALWKVNSKFSFGSLASTNQVFINSDNASEGGADTSFFVSGSVGSRGSAVRGTSLFGGDVLISGSMRSGGQLHMTTHKLVFGDSTARFARFDSNGGDTSAGANNKMTTPYNGRLIKVILRGTVAGNSTVVGFHRNTDGSANVSGTSTEDITVSMGSANTSYTFNFTAAADWAAGDIVGLKINPTDDPGIVIATAVWEFETYA